MLVRRVSVLVVVAASLLVVSTDASAAAKGAQEDDLARQRDAALTQTDPATALAAFYRALSSTVHVPVAGARDALAEDAMKRAASPFVRDAGKRLTAERRARQGKLDESAKLYDELGMPRQVLVVGPFENTGGAAFADPLPAEGALAQGTAAKQEGLGRPVGWQRAPREPHGGQFDLAPRLSPTRETRALVAVVVKSTKAQTAALRLGTSGPFAALVNGAEVLKDDADRSLALDQSAAAIRLEQGDNLLVLRLGHLDGAYAAWIRVTALDGGRLAGVTFSVDESAVKRAGKRAATAAKQPSAAPGVLVDPVAIAKVAAKAKDATADALERYVDLELSLRSSDARLRPTSLDAAMLALVQKLDQKGPRRALAKARFGREMKDRNPTQARAWLEAALQDDPAQVDALMALADLRESQGVVHEARALYAAARAAAPRSPLVVGEALAFTRREGHLGAAVDQVVLDFADQVPVDRALLAAADVARAHGDIARAHRYLAPLAAKDEAGGALAARIDELEAQLGEEGADVPATVAALIDAKKKKLLHEPSSHGVADELATMLWGAGRKVEAKKLADERRKAFPERAEPHTLTAGLALLEGDRAAAKASMELALTLTPQDGRLVKVVRALSAEDVDDLAARYGIDVESVQKDPAPPGALEVGAHVAATTTAVRFFENGLSRSLVDRIVKVHDAKKAQGLRGFPISYTPGREQVDVLLAERVTKDGRTEAARDVVDRSPGGKQGGVYTDVHQKVVVFGELEDGDLLHVRYRKDGVGQQNLFGDFFGQIESVSDTVPVEKWRMVVEAPKSRPLAWGGRGVPAPVITEGDGAKIYDFKVARAPRILPEPNMPPFYEVASYLSVSTYGSWEDLGAWYARLVAPQLELDDELRKVAADAKAKGKDQADVVRRIYEWVVTNTRYVGIELGIHGWKPYKVTEVHRRGFGDCKDKASMLVALLEAAGVPARIALVRTANAGRIEESPASMWNFNHAIAYVPSLDLFLDGTAETSGWKELPPLDQGAMTLVVAPKGSKEKARLATIPMHGPDGSWNSSDYVLQLQHDGTLVVRGKETFRGDHNAEQRVELRDPATRRQLLERRLSSVMPGAAIQKLDVSDLSLTSEEIYYVFEATLPNRAVPDGAAMTMPLSLYPHDLSGNYAQQSRRTQDVWITRPWHTRNVMRYVTPKGARVVDLPQGGVVESPQLRFVQKVTPTADGFIVDEDTTIRVRRIDAADYAAFRDAALKADALMKRKVRIAVTGGAS